MMIYDGLMTNTISSNPVSINRFLVTRYSISHSSMLYCCHLVYQSVSPQGVVPDLTSADWKDWRIGIRSEGPCSLHSSDGPDMAPKVSPPYFTIKHGEHHGKHMGIR